MVTNGTYRVARKELLIAAARYMRYAKHEHGRREQFVGHRKLQQHFMAQLRAEPRRFTVYH